MSRMSRMRQVLGNRAALTLTAWVVYVLAFIPLYNLVGTTTTALVGLPVVVTVWLLGMWAGLLTSLLAFPWWSRPWWRPMGGVSRQKARWGGGVCLR